MEIAVVLVHRNTPDLVIDQMFQIIEMADKAEVTYRIFIIDAGSWENKRVSVVHYWYPDPDFRGKCFAHNKGLEIVEDSGEDFDYYWFNHPDLDFSEDKECLKKLFNIMEANKEIAVLSPTHSTSYIGKNLRTPQGWHKVSAVDYLSLMIRKNCIEKFGFLNPDFKYCWGAIVEYSYWIYSQTDWCVAYAQRAHVKHLGGSTYGKVPATISRGEYISKAKAFCRNYFPKKYGKDWHDTFYNMLPSEIKKYRYSGVSDVKIAKTENIYTDQNPYWIKRRLWDSQ